MKRGGSLPRYTALVAKTPLRRYKGLRRTPLGLRVSGGEGSAVPGHSPAAPKTTKKGSRALGGGLRNTHHQIPADVVAIVQERSNKECEIQLEGCLGRASQRHHRITQKVGGRRRHGRARLDRPSCLLDLCAVCHQVVTDNPKFAYTNGWSLKERQDSATEAVLYRGDLVYLDDAGLIHSYEEAGA